MPFPYENKSQPLTATISFQCGCRHELVAPISFTRILYPTCIIHDAHILSLYIEFDKMKPGDNKE